jgi:DNA mismatch endonuclease (patch repair protein)
MGYRYLVDAEPVPGLRRRADIVFTRARVAVFVDGCFWHGCPSCDLRPKANADWWRAKLDRNRTRDADTDGQLARAGWTVVRAWEHEPLDAVLSRVVDHVTRGRERERSVT